MIEKIISGGQTGADRAAFDAAIERGIEIGGFVPKNRKAEDGPIPAKYKNLVETESEGYEERTKLNVLHSDATLILSHGVLTGGSKLTERFARKAQKPVLHIDFEKFSADKSVKTACEWLESVKPKTLNIAGPRESEDPEIYKAVFEFLLKVF